MTAAKAWRLAGPQRQCSTRLEAVTKLHCCTLLYSVVMLTGRESTASVGRLGDAGLPHDGRMRPHRQQGPLPGARPGQAQPQLPAEGRPEDQPDLAPRDHQPTAAAPAAGPRRHHLSGLALPLRPLLGGRPHRGVEPCHYTRRQQVSITVWCYEVVATNSYFLFCLCWRQKSP